MLIITTFIGFGILIMGRQLFWLFLAGMGFILGLTYASQYYSGQPEWVILVVGMVAGALGAILAYLMQKFAAGLAGFLAGWYLTGLLLANFDINLGQMSQAVPVIGGIIGAMLIAIVFEWSLIVLSSLAGSGIITSNMYFDPQVKNGLFIVLAILGIIIQAILYFNDEQKQT